MTYVSPSNELYPVVIVQDRYGGVYSGGYWIAIANAQAPQGRSSRVDFVRNSGPGGSDLDAAGFWTRSPDWLAVGDTPDEALAHLISGANSIA